MAEQQAETAVDAVIRMRGGRVTRAFREMLAMFGTEFRRRLMLGMRGMEPP